MSKERALPFTCCLVLIHLFSPLFKSSKIPLLISSQPAAPALEQESEQTGGGRKGTMHAGCSTAVSERVSISAFSPFLTKLTYSRFILVFCPSACVTLPNRLFSLVRCINLVQWYRYVLLRFPSSVCKEKVNCGLVTFCSLHPSRWGQHVDLILQGFPHFVGRETPGCSNSERFRGAVAEAHPSHLRESISADRRRRLLPAHRF